MDADIYIKRIGLIVAPLSYTIWKIPPSPLIKKCFLNGLPFLLPAQVDSLEPVEDVHTVLHVHHPDEAGEDTEYGGLRSSEAVNDDGGFVRTGEAGDTVHQVDTVGDGNTEVRPVGTEDDLD